jgi:glycosyltransferase involved in cell wall biosynthesis
MIDLGAKRVLTSLPKLVRYLREETPTSMISAMDHTNLVALWARRLAHVPTRVVVSVHNTLTYDREDGPRLKTWLMPHFIHRFYPNADRIIAVSQGVADDLARTAHLALQDIEVIYNPVVTPDLLDKARATIDHPWFSPHAPPVILGAGRLTKQKDFPTLIKAFARIKEQRPARLLIIGEGEERSDLEALVRALGIEADISLPGYIDNPYAYMHRAAVFVLSSAWEGLPTALIEALACGCPVVSTNCPSGPAEILRDCTCGPLVPVGDIEALTDAVLRTLDASPKAEQLRQQASLFSLEDAVNHYLSALRA